jgi:hypothetical protein
MWEFTFQAGLDRNAESSPLMQQKSAGRNIGTHDSDVATESSPSILLPFKAHKLSGAIAGKRLQGKSQYGVQCFRERDTLNESRVWSGVIIQPDKEEDGQKWRRLEIPKVIAPTEVKPPAR